MPPKDGSFDGVPSGFYRDLSRWAVPALSTQSFRGNVIIRSFGRAFGKMTEISPDIKKPEEFQLC